MAIEREKEMILYLLLLTDPELSYEGYLEDFEIGIFLTEQQAQETAQYYLENIRGFCDFSCTYRIVKKEIVDNLNNRIPEAVWTVQGWNINEDFDEIDIVESACFVTQEHAKEELKRMQKLYQRTEWALGKSIIGDLQWRDGFVRMIGGQPKN